MQRHCLFDLALISRAAAETAQLHHREHRCYRPAANLRTARIAPPEAAKCRLTLVVGTHSTECIQKCTASLATDGLAVMAPGLVFLCCSCASRVPLGAQSHSHSPHTAKLPTTFLCGSWCMKRSPAVNLPSGPRRERDNFSNSTNSTDSIDSTQTDCSAPGLPA